MFTHRDISNIHRVMNGKSPSIYAYQDARRFLLDWLVARQATEPTYSVRKWAREMDISQPGKSQNQSVPYRECIPDGLHTSCSRLRTIDRQRNLVADVEFIRLGYLRIYLKR